MLSYADYLMLISLPDALIKELDRYKRASVNVIGHFEGMHRVPQLIITHQIRCKPFLVQPAIEQMAKRLSTMPPIKLQVKGFGYFNTGPLTCTIYAAIESSSHTDNWFKLLKKQLGIKANNFVPHIAIVSSIPVTAFNKLWPNFKNRQFSASFSADSLTILQKDTFVDYCEFRLYKELFFANRLKEIF